MTAFNFKQYLSIAGTLAVLSCTAPFISPVQAENAGDSGSITIYKASETESQPNDDAHKLGIDESSASSTTEASPAQKTSEPENHEKMGETSPDYTNDEQPIFDMRGDDGVLMDFRPSGISFLSQNRLLVCDENSQQMHIFDTEGRRFRRLEVPRVFSQPRYTGLCNLEDNKFFVIGSHHHINNNTRFLWARGVLHYYELRGERFTDNSSVNNYDPDTAWRNTGFFGESAKQRLKVEGIACNPVDDALYFALSQPVNPDESVIVYKTSLNQVIEKKKKISFEVLKTNLKPGLDASLNEPFILTDIYYLQDKGLLFLLSSRTTDERFSGTSQIWYQPDGSEEARLVADEIAPGNFGSGLAAFKIGNAYNIGIVFDNNPSQNDTPSRFMLLENVDI
ncbi:MAG: hypothetical protein ACI376_09550 [Candidatus Bruticola sp.]